ncbi:MAG: deoxyribodipyrimidine photo-lyase, partial [Alphaproteobacteria bacterium]|nr:deoxyribodipyrimidine photo-lyase [Alphaproteobacteria bacterium]
MSNKPIILWFRQDLRLSDNPALDYAAKSLRPIIPIYILDVRANIGAASKWWLYHSLQSLAQSLNQKLNFFIGSP